MFINWTGFSVTNIKGTRTINVKTEIKLDVFTAYKAKRITQQPFDAHILVLSTNIIILYHRCIEYERTFTFVCHLTYFSQDLYNICFVET